MKKYLTVLLIPLALFFILGSSASAKHPPSKPTATPTATPTPGAWIEYSGNVVNSPGHCLLISGQTHVWVHDWIANGCDGSGIKVLNSSDVKIDHVSITNAKESITILNSSDVDVLGGSLADPTGPKPEGHQVMVNNSFDVTIDGVAMTCSLTCGMEDGVNFYNSHDSIAKNNSVIDGHSPTGCGIVIDSGSQRITVANNYVSWQANCGIGVASGSGHLVDHNDVRYTGQNYYAWKQGPNIPCSVEFINNTGDDGVSNFWNGEGCTVTGQW